MPLQTLLLGAVLVVLGLVGYAASKGASVTALIPAFFGLPLLLLGWLAGRAERPGLWLIVALALAVLGSAGSAQGLAKLPALLSGGAERPLAVAVQSLMAVLCGAYAVSGLLALLRGRS